MKSLYEQLKDADKNIEKTKPTAWQNISKKQISGVLK